MTSVRGRPVQFALTDDSRAIFESIIISRFSVRNDGDEVLRTKRGLAFLPRGGSNWRFALDENDVVVPTGELAPEEPPGSEIPERVTGRAKWHTPKTARAAGITIKEGGNANVFQEFGVVLVPDGFRIPIVEASKANVKHYGLTLVSNHDVFVIVSHEYDLILAQYEYRRNYRRDFLIEETGGGGYFVETHNFPHLHAPLSPHCGGYILIGGKRSADEYDFTAFRIPYGYALYTPANAIHGDGTIVGDYAITVADTSALADTVLFYNETTGRLASDLVPLE